MTDISESAELPSGAASAGLLAAGAGCCALGVLALAADASAPINHLLTFYRPTGALSGVTTIAILLWLGVWYGLAQRWAGKQIVSAKINVGALLLLAAGVLLTFPPFMDFLQGK